MEQMTVTAKMQISVDTDSKVLLDETMSAYLDLFNVMPLQVGIPIGIKVKGISRHYDWAVTSP